MTFIHSSSYDKTIMHYYYKKDISVKHIFRLRYISIA